METIWPVIDWKQTTGNHYQSQRGVDDQGNKYTISANLEVVTVRTKDGFTGQGWTEEEALLSALAERDEVFKKHDEVLEECKKEAINSWNYTDPFGNTFNHANGPHGHTVTVTTQDGFTGQGYTAQDALAGAAAQREEEAKSYVAQPRLADPEALESGLTIAIDGTLLWANLSYIEACEWRQQIWDMKIDYTFRPPCIKVVHAIFPAEA